MKRLINLTATVALLATGCAMQPKAPVALTLADWKQAAEVKNDRMATTIDIRSGGPASRPKYSSRRNIVREGRWFHASIDKKTGLISTSMVFFVAHQTGGWANPTRATYIGIDGQATPFTSVTRAGTDVSCSSASCTYTEPVVAVIKFDELRKLVAAKRTGALTEPTWSTKIFGAGLEMQFDFQWDEVEGFIEAALAQKAQHMKAGG